MSGHESNSFTTEYELAEIMRNYRLEACCFHRGSTQMMMTQNYFFGVATACKRLRLLLYCFDFPGRSISLFSNAKKTLALTFQLCFKHLS